MSELEPDVKISGDLVDRLAALLIWLQNEDPAKMLIHLPELRKNAARMQLELQTIRGPWVVCKVCNPPVRLRMGEELKKHDVEIHHVSSSNIYSGGNHGSQGRVR